MTFRDADEVYAYLNRFLNFERRLEPTEYRLDRMERLKALYGKPDEAYRVVHVAGSKGKGSTATMIASILQASGRLVGLYTSPHLLSYTERIAIGGRPVDDAVLLPAASELADAMEGERPEDFPGGEAPTYFELLTMLGFLCFRRAGCDDAVIEVGLGGRLDSTNVVRPAACVVTPIELEHTELLGDTIPKIAAEKAGILKAGVPAFSSATRPEALAVVRERAEALGCPLVVLDEAASLSGVTIGRDGTSFRLEPTEVGVTPSASATVASAVRATVADSFAAWKGIRARTPLIGVVQARNAAIAAMVSAYLGCGRDDIERGLASARLRARFEILEGPPPAVLDGAHTPDSMAAAASDFKAIFPEGGLLLFGCAKDKDARAMARVLGQAFSEVVITRPGTFKESDPAAMEEAFRSEGFSVERLDDTDAAIERAMRRSDATGRPLLVAGSFYLCAAAAPALDARSRRGLGLDAIAP